MPETLMTFVYADGRCLGEFAADTLSPGEQLALLSLIRDDLLAEVVHAHLRKSTARADYAALCGRDRLVVASARRKPKLTVHGRAIGRALAHELGKRFGIAVPVFPGRSSTLRPGLFSQAGNA